MEGLATAVAATIKRKSNEGCPPNFSQYSITVTVLYTSLSAHLLGQEGRTYFLTMLNTFDTVSITNKDQYGKWPFLPNAT